MARPRIEIDEKEFKKLCELQCTLTEIAGFFDCSEDTIERWCKRKFNEGFADTFKKQSTKGKMSLRRTQFKLAETNAAMAIFLGKQYLGQTDRQEMNVDAKVEHMNEPDMSNFSEEDLIKIKGFSVNEIEDTV